MRRTLETKLNEIKGEIEENWKFNGQLKINLHKSNKDKKFIFHHL
jgi:hypothetical protein